MTPTLPDIDTTIRSNFVLRKMPNKPFQTDREWESRSQNTARLVFVGIADQYGFSMQQICDHLQMTGKDYLGHLSRFKDLMVTGKRKYEQVSTGELRYEKDIVEIMDLRVYRKVVLIKNHLQLLCHTKSRR